MFDLKWFLQLKWVTVIKLENKNEQNMISWASESCSPENSLPEHCPPPRKLPPMKITPYKNTHLWKFPPLKILPSENRPLENCHQENYHQKINPKKTVPYKSCHHSLEKLKVVTMQSRCSHEKQGLVPILVVMGFVEVQIPI